MNFLKKILLTTNIWTVVYNYDETSIHEFVCPYNLSISGKQIWLDVCNRGLRETILLELWYPPYSQKDKWNKYP